MNVTRRDFLKTGLVGMSAFLLPTSLGRVARAASVPDPVLVALYLRGGADGLNLVVPTGDPFYYSNRLNIQVPFGSELALDGFYGLNPALLDLHPFYQSSELAILHAVGSTDPSRSHFDAQDFMERAAPGNKSIVDGWLNRYLVAAGMSDPISGISISGAKVKAMVGPAPSLAFKSIDSFKLLGEFTAERRVALQSRYSTIPTTILGSSVSDALSAVDVISAVSTATGVVYPNTNLGAAMRDAAALIKAEIGVKAIAIDLGGWDHHSDEITNIFDVGGNLAGSLKSFQEDLGATYAPRTLTLCMTEFGRRVAENGGAGTDHGHGSAMFAIGGGVAGGQVLTKDGQWPGLAPENLSNGQDLAVTTDFRDVFAEVLNKHMLLNDVSPIFPDFSVDPGNFPGLYP